MIRIRHGIDWLNTLLLLVSAAAAFVLPFEVFLFAYAVLGPLHYLTEISWLHERKYFATNRSDAWLLLFFAVALFGLSFFPMWFASEQWRQQNQANLGTWGAMITYLAFFAAVGMVVFQSATSKWLLLFIAAVLAMGLSKIPAWLIFFAAFLPTIVHVFIFTLLFMLSGAIRSKSIPGFINVLLFPAIAVGLLLIRQNHVLPITAYAMETYPGFSPLNRQIATHFFETQFDQLGLYHSKVGIAIMRFIAFAYTYHYLNWFSKTSIIRWHQVDKKRLLAVFLLWLAAVALYAWNYKLGFIALYTLSFLHVFLEFPLNWRSMLELGGYGMRVFRKKSV